MSNDCNGVSLSTRSCESTSGKFYFCISFAQITIDSSSSSRVFEKRTFSLFFSLSLFLSLGPYFFLKILSLWPSFISSKFFFPFCPEFIWRTHETKSMIVTISLLDSISPQISPRFFSSLDSSLASISLTQTEHECSFHRKRKKKKKQKAFIGTIRFLLFFFTFHSYIDIQQRELCDTDKINKTVQILP